MSRTDKFILFGTFIGGMSMSLIAQVNSGGINPGDTLAAIVIVAAVSVVAATMLDKLWEK